MIWVAVALAGGIGAVVRDRTAEALHARQHGALWATALVNLVGALGLGLLLGIGSGPTGLVVIGVGLLGGLTTFSTWMTQATATPGGAVRAVVVIGQLTAGPVLAWAGITAGRAL
ncbi:MAG TPA: CrcB family protein [Nitriliruptorales bacterium]